MKIWQKKEMEEISSPGATETIAKDIQNVRYALFVQEGLVMANRNDIDKARRKKRDRSGWALEEIKKNAEKELEKFKGISKDEPSDLRSGDMNQIILGEDDDESDKEQ